MGRHLTLLECSTDGRIDDAAWREARARDAAEVKQGCASVRVAAVRPTEGELVRRMGRIIADAAVKRAAVHRLDFEREGIDEITARRLFPRALARARAREPAIDAIAETAA